MIDIEIQHVGPVRVLQMQTCVGVGSPAVVLVDRDPEMDRNIIDRYVVWNLSRKEHSVCFICHQAIERNDLVGWVNAKGRPVDGHRHNPITPVTVQYFASTGDYHIARLAAEETFQRRAGGRE